MELAELLADFRLEERRANRRHDIPLDLDQNSSLDQPRDVEVLGLQHRLPQTGERTSIKVVLQHHAKPLPLLEVAQRVIDVLVEIAAFWLLPDPEIAILDVGHQLWRRQHWVPVIPRQARAALLHVEDHMQARYGIVDARQL